MAEQDNNTNKPLKSPHALREERVLAYWKEKGIFEKSLEKEAPKGEFVFYDGPPFATGEPHYGHLLAGTMKDAIPRYKTMQGYKVRRRWGWDCHGLPVENLVEKLIGLKSKKDIEEYGIEKFNDEARKSVMKYDQVWKEIVPRFGRWVDMENHYKTMDSSYTETIWWIFKQLYDKKLAYEGFKSMHLCPHCETTLSNFEVTQGYKEIKDLSVTVKFKLKTQNAKLKSEDNVPTYILAWTTTPWTLPGNVALAVNREFDYLCVQVDKSQGTLVTVGGVKNQQPSELRFVTPGRYIFARSLYGKFSDILIQSKHSKSYKDYKANLIKESDFLNSIEAFKGSDLVGLEYEPLFDYYSKDEKLENHKNGWKIYGADFVTTEDGTGVVHIAPAFGEDDMALGKNEKMPFIQHVGSDGRFKSEVKDFAGLSVKPKGNPRETDEKVVKFLEEKEKIFAREDFTHSYPFCWRCDTPLLNYAANSWFVDVPKIKDKIIVANKKVHWIPDDIRDGRFGKWLEGARDWAISRSRYWGASIPVWKCDKCQSIEVVGSVEELKNKMVRKNKYFVMRHGQADNNVGRFINSNNDNLSHLTELGKKEIEKTARILRKEKIDIVISSPLERAAESATIVAEAIGFKKDDIIFDKRICELNAGVYDSKSVDDYWGFFQDVEDRFKKTPEGGENYSDIKKRMGDFIYDIDQKYKDKKILIVSHETPIWLLWTAVSGLSPKEAVKFRGDKDFIENAEIKKLDFATIPHNRDYELDLHRPFIDEIKFKCKCGGEMKRMPDVFDCWFESGSMPYAQNHYPFENLDIFDPKKDRGFPADFIAEGLDQTRGWFYSMIVLSVALFGESSYRNVIVNGIVLAEDGQKMSKRLKNYPDPMDVVNKYGADAIRYYMMSSPAVRAEDMRFAEKGVDEINKKLNMRLLNVCSFYELYADRQSRIGNSQSKHILDRWIISRLNQIIGEITAGMESYELDKASRPLMDFVDDLSVWYLRRSRERFKGDDENDKKAALETMNFVLLELSKLLAPFTPFLAEEVYQKAGGELESVHLEDWPVAGKVDQEVLTAMSFVRSFSTMALMQRNTLKINVRQPLKSLSIKHGAPAPKYWDEFKEILKDEVNVKEVILKGGVGQDAPMFELDPTMTPELIEEGQVRELLRKIQDMRKEKGLSVGDTANLMATVDLQELISKNEKLIKKTAGLVEIQYGDKFELL